MQKHYGKYKVELDVPKRYQNLFDATNTKANKKFWKDTFKCIKKKCAEQAGTVEYGNDLCSYAVTPTTARTSWP